MGCTDTSDQRHFGPRHFSTIETGPTCPDSSALVPKCPYCLQLGHFSRVTQVRMSRATHYRGAIGLHKDEQWSQDDPAWLNHSRHFEPCLEWRNSSLLDVDSSSFGLNMAVRQTSIICATDIARQQRRPEQGFDGNCVTNDVIMYIRFQLRVRQLCLLAKLQLCPSIGHFYDWNTTSWKCLLLGLISVPRRCQSVWTLRYQCRYVLQTLQHWCRTVSDLKCLHLGWNRSHLGTDLGCTVSHFRTGIWNRKRWRKKAALYSNFQSKNARITWGSTDTVVVPKIATLNVFALQTTAIHSVDRFWMNQDVVYDFTADLAGTGDISVSEITET